VGHGLTAALAFDEGPGVGLGHRRRMQVLARELDVLGIGTELCPLTGGRPTAAVVVVDSYRERADEFDAGAVVAIEDLGRDLAVDLVVDPDPGADASVFARAQHVLAGSCYALVDPALRNMPSSSVYDAVERVLVSTGASDEQGIGAQIASDVAAAVPGVNVRYVVGPWGRADASPRVQLVRSPDGLAAELAAADLVVTAGGVTMLEACALGRPTVAFSLAANQDRAVAGAAHAGAVLAADAASAAHLAARLAGDRELRARLSTFARTLVDSQGATRVAAAVATIASHDTHSR
jgi:spore coat polysaccharide biosynthesis predicted glycosyltransferase SpsG